MFAAALPSAAAARSLFSCTDTIPSSLTPLALHLRIKPWVGTNSQMEEVFLCQGEHHREGMLTMLEVDLRVDRHLLGHPVYAERFRQLSLPGTHSAAKQLHPVEDVDQLIALADHALPWFEKKLGVIATRLNMATARTIEQLAKHRHIGLCVHLHHPQHLEPWAADVRWAKQQLAPRHT